MSDLLSEEEMVAAIKQSNNEFVTKKDWGHTYALTAYYNVIAKAQSVKTKKGLMGRIRSKVANLYKEAIKEMEEEPFNGVRLNAEHKCHWRGHTNALSDVLSIIDEAPKKEVEDG